MVIWKNQQENGMHLLQNRGRKEGRSKHTASQGCTDEFQKPEMKRKKKTIYVNS